MFRQPELHQPLLAPWSQRRVQASAIEGLQEAIVEYIPRTWARKHGLENGFAICVALLCAFLCHSGADPRCWSLDRAGLERDLVMTNVFNGHTWLRLGGRVDFTCLSFTVSLTS